VLDVEEGKEGNSGEGKSALVSGFGRFFLLLGGGIFAHRKAVSYLHAVQASLARKKKALEGREPLQSTLVFLGDRWKTKEIIWRAHCRQIERA